MKILFIGIGNMGGAILKSLLNQEKKYDIYVAGRSLKKIEDMKKYGDFKIFNPSLSSEMDVIFLGVKPYQIKEAAQQHLKELSENQLIISMAAGCTIESLEEIFGKDKKIVRIMPNTPVLVNEGMTSITGNNNCAKEDIEKVIELLQGASQCKEIPEDKIHGFIGMAGSSPAFAYMFLEAMGDAGVKYGLTREEAYYFAAQSFIGAGKMLRENITNPGVLKDAVTSPGGTTIEGVCTLEEYGFRNAIIKAVSKTIEKSIQMSEKKY